MIEIVLIAVALAMDAFAVSVCKGLAMQRITLKKAAIVGLWFGGFQALMLALGYFLGRTFADRIEAVDHWVAFILLAIIGANMIKESLDKDEEKVDASLDVKTMFVMAAATSIDALAVGVTFALEGQNIVFSAAAIGIITFIISALGVKIGSVFGTKYKSKAEFVGGVVLVGIGLKILLEGIGVI